MQGKEPGYEVACRAAWGRTEKVGVFFLSSPVHGPVATPFLVLLATLYVTVIRFLRARSI